MKIIIIGAGRIGTNLAKPLIKENHEVYLIEKDEEISRKAGEKLDVKVVSGNGADPKVLNQAKVGEADLVLAVTTSDETNLVACSLAALLGAKRQIARVRNVSFDQELGKEGYRHFHIDKTINPEKVAAQAIVKSIKTPGAREVGDFDNGKILIRALDIAESSPLCGLKIQDFSDENFPWPFLIVAIIRQEEVFIPSGDTTLEASDKLYVLIPEGSLAEFLSFADPEVREIKKVVIYGASITGEHVAQSLKGSVKDVVLLEENSEKAEDAAERLEAVRVINGSASEKEILVESGIEAADVFVAASDNDHANLISAVLAKKMGAKTTIITTQEPDYMSIVDAMNIDFIVNPHILAVEHILTLARGKGLIAVTKLLDCDAEALEFVAQEGAAITKTPLKEVNFPKDAIVGAVCRGHEVKLANGDMKVNPGERVIVFCRESAVKKLQNIFTKKSLF